MANANSIQYADLCTQKFEEFSNKMEARKQMRKVETNRVPSFIRMLVEISSKIRPVQEMSADSTILMEPKKLNGKENHTKEIHTTRIIILK